LTLELFVGTYAELDNWGGTVSYFFDGSQYTQVTFGGVTVQNDSQGVLVGVNNITLEAGTTHTLRAETTAVQSGDHIVDVLFASLSHLLMLIPDATSLNLSYSKRGTIQAMIHQ